jgi:hypothetical protein
MAYGGSVPEVVQQFEAVCGKQQAEETIGRSSDVQECSICCTPNSLGL